MKARTTPQAAAPIVHSLKYVENFSNPPYVKLIIVCKICNKDLSASKPSDWKRHYFTHSDEKPHKCSMCPKSFIRADQLRKHEAKVHSSGTAATNVKREDLKPEPVQQDHNTNPYFMQFNLS